ncbi:MAG: fibronectin type III domain-containing protein [Minisyncoccota bacterium]
MKNSSIWIWVGVIVLVVLGAWFLMSNTATTQAPGTTYNGTSTTTLDTTATTNGTDTAATGAKPVVTTAGFASVSSTTAVVVGTVIPNGAPTTYWFEYGPTMSYGSSADSRSAEASYTKVGAAAYITGLKPNTEYYFRIGAKNAYGETYGSQYKFITATK